MGALECVLVCSRGLERHGCSGPEVSQSVGVLHSGKSPVCSSLCTLTGVAVGGVSLSGSVKPRGGSRLKTLVWWSSDQDTPSKTHLLISPTREEGLALRPGDPFALSRATPLSPTGVFFWSASFRGVGPAHGHAERSTREPHQRSSARPLVQAPSVLPRPSLMTARRGSRAVPRSWKPRSRAGT